jgi:hypothetical protein
MRSFRIPMTIQVGACCADGAFVLVGDTKTRTNDPQLPMHGMMTNTVIHAPKITFGGHGIAVATAGEEGIGINAGGELADYLSSLNPLPNRLEQVLIAWGNDFFIRQYPSASTNRDYPPCSLLVVNPQSEFCPLSKLAVNYKSAEQVSSRVIVNGHNTNPAVFWLEYTKVADKSNEMPLADVTGVAMTTVLAAGALNGFGIGGLEVHQYENGKWATWSRAEIETTRAFGAIGGEIKTKVCQLGIRPVTPDPA